eukprot:Colp12_sorted_trinity150504_noHs@33160
MADKRKLQAEIDKVLKKVTEGIEEFDTIWEKVQSAASVKQKEKYEGDLKTEIKKLQRLRDQIKSWLTNNDIKDKSVLYDNRRLIETKMELFKDVEREAKTKAFSKAGLIKGEKLDPKEKAKEDMRMWIQSQIDNLNLQKEILEAKVEELMLSGKKKVDKSRVAQLEEQMTKHDTHIINLETILRMLENDSIQVEQIEPIKEDVDHYVEHNQEDGFVENEYIYDDLNLEQYAELQTGNHDAVSEEEEEDQDHHGHRAGRSGSVTSTTGTTARTSGSKKEEDDATKPKQ